MCAISGVLVLSLPIPIIAGNFEAFHKNQQKKDKAEKSKKKLKAAKIAEYEERFAFCSSRVGFVEKNSCGEDTEHLLGRSRTWHGGRTHTTHHACSP